MIRYGPGQSLVDLSGVLQYQTPRSLGTPLHILDTFTGSDGTDLTAHTPDINTTGNPWVRYSTNIGRIQIKSNTAQSINGYGGVYCIDTGASDCVISFDAYYKDSPSYGVGAIARLLDGSNYLRADLYYRKLNIMDIVAGVLTARASTSVTVVDATWYRMTLTLSGQSITFAGSMGSVTYSTSFNQSATRHGLVIASDLGAIQAAVDNFEVTP